MKTIKIKTKKIYSHDDFGKPNIEKNVISLGEGKPFNGFIRFLNSQRFSECPVVLKVIETTKNNTKDVSGDKPKKSLLTNIEIYQNEISNTYGSAKKAEKIDYKLLSEQKEKENAELKAKNEQFEERLKKLEQGNDPELSEEDKSVIAKYTELFGKEPDKRMKIETIKTKIEEKEKE